MLTRTRENSQAQKRVSLSLNDCMLSHTAYPFMTASVPHWQRHLVCVTTLLLCDVIFKSCLPAVWSATTLLLFQSKPLGKNRRVCIQRQLNQFQDFDLTPLSSMFEHTRGWQQ